MVADDALASTLRTLARSLREWKHSQWAAMGGARRTAEARFHRSEEALGQEIEVSWRVPGRLGWPSYLMLSQTHLILVPTGRSRWAPPPEMCALVGLSVRLSTVHRFGSSIGRFSACPEAICITAPGHEPFWYEEPSEFSVPHPREIAERIAVIKGGWAQGDDLTRDDDAAGR